MACLFPRIAYECGKNPETGKKQIAFSIKTANTFKEMPKKIELPCGQCLNCRLQKSKTWAVRSMLEAREHGDNNISIALTYDDEHLPLCKATDIDTGETITTSTLNYPDVQKFMKRLRKALNKGQYKQWKFEKQTELKFKMAGEYGDEFGRAHYHMMLFNIKIPDIKPHHRNKKGNMVYTSEILNNLWGMGWVSVDELNYEIAAYISRYIMKKQTGKMNGVVKKIDPETGQTRRLIGPKPEFTTQSNRGGGIGKAYYEKNKNKIYETDEIFIATKKGVQKTKPCRYFDTLYEEEEPEKIEAIKKQRQKIAKITKEAALKNTDKEEQEYNKVLLENKQDKIKSLKRGF